MDLVALVIAIVAVGISALSAWYTHREAVAAEDALGIEQKRELERARPPVSARFEDWLKVPLVARFSLENRGTTAVDSVVVKVLTGDSKLVGFARDETHIRRREHDFGRLGPGETARAEFVVIDSATLDEPKVKFLATYKTDADEWDELLDVDLPRQGPWAAWA
ncbi:hypothetical protein [Jiangella muralis]|uniref:hypothetical protein n=1 Tax=Jiangella muralis TaxID=702383 RepID=UPI00069DF46D|nr:hypothetical protein [Jiangella muralis]